MPVAALCPSCAAPLSEASVLALAPICGHCGVVITSIGGTLGLTGAYGVNDSTLSRRRVEADLAVFREYQMKYAGMKEACLQQLSWGVERYATLPQRPDLLALKPVPAFWPGFLAGLGGAIIWLFGAGLAGGVAMVIAAVVAEIGGDQNKEGLFINLFALIVGLIVFGGSIGLALSGPFVYFRAQAANGSMPQENARRQRAYDEAVVHALKAAEPRKAAEDHRLRSQVRELESLAKTVAAKEVEVRRLLAAL